MRTMGGFWSVLLSFWAALLICAAYAGAGYLAISIFINVESALDALRFFIFDYGGLIAGTAGASLFLMSILVLRAIPELIEDAIEPSEISETPYGFWRARLQSPHLGLAQFATYFIGGFGIYSLFEFPVSQNVQLFFVAFTALQYAFGGFIGRKLWCVGHMLRSLENVTPQSNLLEIEALPRLIYLINIFTFLTLLMTVIHTYFHARPGLCPKQRACKCFTPISLSTNGAGFASHRTLQLLPANGRQSPIS